MGGWGERSGLWVEASAAESGGATGRGASRAVFLLLTSSRSAAPAAAGSSWPRRRRPPRARRRRRPAASAAWCLWLLLLFRGARRRRSLVLTPARRRAASSVAAAAREVRRASECRTSSLLRWRGSCCRGSLNLECLVGERARRAAEGRGASLEPASTATRGVVRRRRSRAKKGRFSSFSALVDGRNFAQSCALGRD